MTNGYQSLDPGTLAFDAAGDLFAAEDGVNRVAEIQAASTGGRVTILWDPGPNGVQSTDLTSVYVNDAGDLFVLDGAHGRIIQAHRTQPAAISFPTATQLGTTDTADGPETANLINIGNAPLTLSGISFPADFTEFSGINNSCTAATSLSVGAHCNIPIEFTPENPGTLTENLTISSNAAGAQQKIPLTGITQSGTPAVLATPTPNSILSGHTATFSWAAVTGGTGYALWLGTTGVGSDNLYEGGIHTNLSTTVSGLPANGTTVYARLWTSFNGALAHTDAVYTSSTWAVLTSPTPGTMIVGPSATFTWSSAPGATGYALWLGTTGAGSDDILEGGIHPLTSLTVNSLPTTGQTLYARLSSQINGTLVYNDYVYTGSQARMISPTPGAVLAGPSVAFSWTAGTNASGYALWAGTTGIGSYDILQGGFSTATSLTVGNLPVNGKTVYVRLWTMVNGVKIYNDYTYKATQPAVMISPANNSQLTSSLVTFSWTPISGATNYTIEVGTKGVGSSDIEPAYITTSTGLGILVSPTNGEPVYVRLTTNYNGTSFYNDYTYTAATPATMASPAPNSTLQGSSVTFTWNPGIVTDAYIVSVFEYPDLTQHIYYSGTIYTNSVTVTGLPTQGETLYVVLQSFYGTDLGYQGNYIGYNYTAGPANSSAKSVKLGVPLSDQAKPPTFK